MCAGSQFGFVMMGTATFGIIVRTMIFSKIQTALGLMRTATLGALMGTVTCTLPEAHTLTVHTH